MRTLVSGASGFLGTALVARLRAEGHEVHRLVRSAPNGTDVLIDLDARQVDDTRLPGGLGAIDAVLHLMGEPITPARWGPSKRERLRSSRITSTDLVARALAQHGAPGSVLVCASAIGIYGDRGEEVLDEDSGGGDGFLADLCRSWECAADPARAAGIRVVHLRTGLVLGRGGGLLGAQLPAFRFGLGARLGSGQQWNSWIALDDEIAAMLHAMTCEQLAGPCNLVAPAPVRNRELTDAIAAAVGRRAFLAVPTIAIEAAIGRRNAHELALASQRVLPKRLLTTGFSYRAGDLATALHLALEAGPAGSTR
ncbi:MAG: TIGR01777 family oxidoreductase [Actinomycetota bacterium]|nr:TIGR01777 family oxidoreductase [Actinomycetota bacterium]